MSEIFQARDYRILVVDDDFNIVDVMRMYLENVGFDVSCCYDGQAALSRVRQGGIHLVVMDIMMPDMDGWTLCREVRNVEDIPVLMVTAKGEGTDKLKGFGVGADDYLVKPFDPNELVARVTALIRRSYQPRKANPKNYLRFGGLSIDTVRHNVTVDGHVTQLSAREYHLLRIFAENPNHVLSRQQLLDLVWGIDYFGEDRVVDVFVKRLRHKLGQKQEDWEISTIRGMGYKFAVKE